MKQISHILLSFIVTLLLISFGYAQKADLIFSHSFHVIDVEAECIACHSLAEESAMSSDNLLPDMEACYQCHDEDSECTLCHKDPDNAIAYPRITSYISNFPHATHIANGAECSSCHTGVKDSENISDSHLPSMVKCQTCHDDLEKANYCIDCHAASEDLRPTDHKMDWSKSHGMSSQLVQDCKSCHSENQCLDCHQGDNLDRKVHPLNFVHNHSLSAKGNKDNCYTCHEELSFCSDCHRQELVLPRSHNSAGWSNLSNGGRHARDARMDLDSCQSCHSDTNGEPICAQCHGPK
jgi:hypothetical protein